MRDLLMTVDPYWSLGVPIMFDFSACSFLSAQAGILLANLALSRRQKGWITNVDWDSVELSVYERLVEWNLADILDGEDQAATDQAVPFLHQHRPKWESVVEFVDRCMIHGQATIRGLRAGLRKEVRSCFCELFFNVFRHSESPVGGTALCQLEPTENRFHVCVCDAGIGIVGRVQSSGFGLGSPTAAIKWALERGHSTWLGPVPAGLGLYLLREFVKINGGSFRIYANNGYYGEDAGNAVEAYMFSGYPGTLVELRLKTSDPTA